MSDSEKNNITQEQKPLNNGVDTHQDNSHIKDMDVQEDNSDDGDVTEESTEESDTEMVMADSDPEDQENDDPQEESEVDHRDDNTSGKEGESNSFDHNRKEDANQEKKEKNKSSKKSKKKSKDKDKNDKSKEKKKKKEKKKEKKRKKKDKKSDETKDKKDKKSSSKNSEKKESEEQQQPKEDTIPLKIGVITVTKLGTIDYERPQYHNDRYIYPIGFQSKRGYNSYVENGKRTTYVCEILDGGEAPLYRITADDDPEHPVYGTTSSGVWSSMIKRVQKKKGKRRLFTTVSGPEYYGLSNPRVQKMIEKLPNADKCERYVSVDVRKPPNPAGIENTEALTEESDEEGKPRRSRRKSVIQKRQKSEAKQQEQNEPEEKQQEVSKNEKSPSKIQSTYGTSGLKGKPKRKRRSSKEPAPEGEEPPKKKQRVATEKPLPEKFPGISRDKPLSSLRPYQHRYLTLNLTSYDGHADDASSYAASHFKRGNIATLRTLRNTVTSLLESAQRKIGSSSSDEQSSNMETRNEKMEQENKAMESDSPSHSKEDEFEAESDNDNSDTNKSNSGNLSSEQHQVSSKRQAYRRLGVETPSNVDAEPKPEEEKQHDIDKLQTMWEFAQVCHLIQLLRRYLKLPEFTIEEFEDAIVDPAPRENSLLLSELHTRIIKGPSIDKRSLMLMRTNTEVWVGVLRNKLDALYPQFWDCNPLENTHYYSIDIPLRVLILKALCDWKFENEKIQYKLRNEYGDFLRVLPMAYDAQDNAYWYFGHDVGRVYREAHPVIEDKQLSNRGNWETVCYGPDEMQELGESFEQSVYESEIYLRSILLETHEHLRAYQQEREKERQALRERQAQLEQEYAAQSEAEAKERTASEGSASSRERRHAARLEKFEGEEHTGNESHLDRGDQDGDEQGKNVVKTRSGRRSKLAVTSFYESDEEGKSRRGSRSGRGRPPGSKTRKSHKKKGSPSAASSSASSRGTRSSRLRERKQSVSYSDQDRDIEPRDENEEFDSSATEEDFYTENGDDEWMDETDRDPNLGRSVGAKSLFLQQKKQEEEQKENGGRAPGIPKFSDLDINVNNNDNNNNNDKTQTPSDNENNRKDGKHPVSLKSSSIHQTGVASSGNFRYLSSESSAKENVREKILSQMNPNDTNNNNNNINNTDNNNRDEDVESSSEEEIEIDIE